MRHAESNPTLADIYDLLNPEDADINYYLKEAKKARGKILEIGCGTGRVMLKLLKHNIDVEGLDISKKMLEILKTKAKIHGLKPKIYRADMRTFSLRSRYSLILVPYGTFMYLSSEKERLDTLKRIHKHLHKNGTAIIHTYRPSAAEIKSIGSFQPIDVSFFRIDGKKITAIWYVKYSPLKEELTYRVSLCASKNKVRNFDTRLYLTSYEKMIGLFKKAGFRKIKTYSDFGGTIFNQTRGTLQGQLVWVAKK